jgi:hypothetical protein
MTMRQAERTLLFVDDHDILYRPGVGRALRPLDRHPNNPVVADKKTAWELDLAWCSVYRDPDSGLYQLWYQAFTDGKAQERTHRCMICYAESSDGINWTKPNLGLYDYNGVAETNIVLLGNGGYSDRYGASVLVDPADPDPSRRYKMAHYDFCIDTDEGREYPGLTVAFSPDGVHWTKYPRAPLLRTCYSGFDVPVPYRDEPGQEWNIPLSISDAIDAIYDPRAGAFVIYHKMWIDRPDGLINWKHAMGRTQSADFIHWSRPELVLAPDEHDPEWVEFHHSPAFFYNDCYFGLLQILNRAERGGIMDCELAISRDGFNWQRPFRSPFFLPMTHEGGFDSGSILTNATPVLLEDEFRFYYGGYSQGATGVTEGEMVTGIGLATMPRDRFASLRPVKQIGQATLRRTELTGCSAITLNADATRGSVRVEVLDADGYRVRGFTREEAIPITGDDLRHPVRWREREVTDLPAGEYMLRLHLDQADVYAMTLLTG